MNGVESVQSEVRKITDDGYLYGADVDRGELGAAAKCYADLAMCQVMGAVTVEDFADGNVPPPSEGWPWGKDKWVPHVLPKNNYKRAAGLISLEIDRLTSMGQ